jgi:actin-like ATPase involved in cell morphogenesis
MNTVIAEGNQILLQEPTVVAIVVNEQKMVEWGRQRAICTGASRTTSKSCARCSTG